MMNPAGHDLQASAVDWASPASEYFPLVQFVHTSADVCISPAVEYLPAEHALQTSAVDWASPASEYFPLVQFVHTSAPAASENFPAAQLEQSEISS
jgi:predicted peptidase